MLTAFVILGLAVTPGLVLWWPSRADPTCRSDLGVALMTGALIAFAVFGVQVLVEVRAEERALERDSAAELRDLRLQLALSETLVGIHLDGEELQEMHLYEKDLTGASLIRTHLERANLDQATLRGAHLNNANLSDATLVQTKLQHAQLPGAVFARATLLGATLEHAQLPRAKFTGATLTRANFRHAVLAGATLQGADLAGATFACADLAGANLARAEVDASTDFSGAWYDHRTVWPASASQPKCERSNVVGCRVKGAAKCGAQASSTSQAG